MRRFLLIALGLGALTLLTAEAQQPSSAGPGKILPLTPLDYVEIRQLAARYAHAVDQGADNGYAYADLFASDGAFGDTRGRDELAALAKKTARGPQTAWHFIVNHVIEPTEDGARGKEYLLHLRYGEPGQPNIVWGGGHYEDTYVRTLNGWRFKTRRFIRSEAAAVGASTAGDSTVHGAAPVALTAPAATLTATDYLEIEQLVHKYGWALDSGERNGYAYADLYVRDGVFTGTNQRPSGRSYEGRDNLAALARGGRRGPLNVSHLVTNVVVTPTAGGAAGRVYVGIVDLGEAAGSPSAGHGGFYDDEHLKTDEGWRIERRSYYESKWGEPTVQVPQPLPPLRALAAVDAARVSGAKGSALTAQDYVEIQQLVANYPYTLDMNDDDGRSYANLFTPDGSFACVLPDEPAGCEKYTGRPISEIHPRAKGREALAKMVDAEERHAANYTHHFIFNHVIEATAGGAIGKEYVAVVDIVSGQQGQPHSIFAMGRYDDEYVKTPDGWRIKTRVFTEAARRLP